MWPLILACLLLVRDVAAVLGVTDSGFVAPCFWRGYFWCGVAPLAGEAVSNALKWLSLTFLT